MTLGQRIQQHRIRLGLSQEGLGEKLGVSRQSVSKWEADGAVPDTDKLIALSKLFGITLNELLQVEPPVQEAPEPAEASAGEETPAEKKSARPRWRVRLAIVLACLTLVTALSSYTITVGRMLGRANDRIAQLEWDVSLLEGRVRELESKGVGLDPAAPLVAAFDFHLETVNSHTVLHLDLTPYQIPEGLSVTFTAGGLYGFETVQAEQGTAGHYTAALQLQDPAGDVTVTALFSDGTRQYTQALVRITSISQNGCSWESLWERD